MKSDSYVRFLRSDDYSAVLRVALSNQQAGQNKRSAGKPSVTTVVQSTTGLTCDDFASSIVGGAGGLTARSTPTPTKPRASN